VEGAGNVVSIFPRDSKRAAEHARERLGSTEYDMLVEQGRCLTSDELADFIRSELGALAIRADPPLDAGSSEVYG